MYQLIPTCIDSNSTVKQDMDGAGNMSGCFNDVKFLILRVFQSL